MNRTGVPALPSAQSQRHGGTLADFRTPGAACEVCGFPGTKVLITEVCLHMSALGSSGWLADMEPTRGGAGRVFESVCVYAMQGTGRGLTATKLGSYNDK